MPNDTGTANVVKLGNKQCKPFLLQVMVFSPEVGFKFEVMIERACTPSNDPIWKLVFDLYKRNAAGDGFDQIVHVSFRAGTEEETDGIKRIAADGVSSEQADVLVNEVFETAKTLEGVPTPTDEQKKALRTSMSKVTTTNVDLEG